MKIKNKNKFIISVLLLGILMVQFSANAVKSEKSSDPNFGNDAISRKLTETYYKSTTDSVVQRINSAGLLVNPLFGAKINYAYFSSIAYSNTIKRFINFATLAIENTNISTVSQDISYLWISSWINSTGIESYNFIYELLFTENSTHYIIRFNYFRLWNGGNLALYTSYFIYIPKPNLKTIDFVVDSQLWNNNGQFYYSSLLTLTFNYESTHLTHYYLLSGVSLGSAYTFYLKNNTFDYFRDSQTMVYYSKNPNVEENNLLGALESYFSDSLVSASQFYSINWYVENRLSNRYDLSEYVLPSNMLDESTYWTYSVFFITEKELQSIQFSQNYSVYNRTAKATDTETYTFEINYTTYKLSTEPNKFYYSTATIKNEQLGNWKSFNFVRNALVFVINAVIFILQAILYLLIIAFNYLILWVVFQIFILLWNYPVYWLFYGLIAVIFYLSFFFVWIWNEIVILWERVLLPILIAIWNWIIENVWNSIVEFFQNGGLKILFDFYMIILSYVIATLLWVLTFGATDFSTIQQSIQTMLLSINSTIFEFIGVFLANFVLILSASATYVLLIGLIYIKYIYAKSRGYVQRASRLQSMINVYKLPLVLVARVVAYFIGFINGG